MEEKDRISITHNLNPLCTHPPLEVRNAELYDYWCPNAHRVDVTDFSYIHLLFL